MSKELETLVLPVSEEAIELGAKIIANGGLVVFPTETVYGIGCNALKPDAVNKIFAAKGRPQDNPLIVHIGATDETEVLTKKIPHKAKQLMNAFWPGPLTIVLEKSDIVPFNISAGLPTVAIRYPSHPVALELIRKSGVPIAAPSANISGRPSATTVQHCTSDLMGKVDLILDGGSCEVGLESTVISLLTEIPIMLRPGKITVEQIESIVGPIDITPGVFKELDNSDNPLSPGLKHKHYAPKAKVVLVHGSPQDFSKYCKENYSLDTWAMAFSEDMKYLDIPAVSYGSSNNPDEQAINIFSKLRELDEKSAENIFVHAPLNKGVGLAVYNRLLRAASFNEVHL